MVLQAFKNWGNSNGIWFFERAGAGKTFASQVPAWPSTSEPLMIVYVGSFSSLCKIFDRLFRSDTCSSTTWNELPIEKFCLVKSGPQKLLTSECLEADVRTVTTSFVCFPFQTCKENIGIDVKQYQYEIISLWDLLSSRPNDDRTYNRSSITAGCWGS